MTVLSVACQRPLFEREQADRLRYCAIDCHLSRSASDVTPREV